MELNSNFKIEITDTADMLEITSDTTEQYITSENQTVQYTAKVYKSITTEKTNQRLFQRK